MRWRLLEIGVPIRKIRRQTGECVRGIVRVRSSVTVSAVDSRDQSGASPFDPDSSSLTETSTFLSVCVTTVVDFEFDAVADVLCEIEAV